MNPIVKTYDAVSSAVSRLQSPLLLAIRLYWGYQFVQDGWGKLTHLDKVTEFFTSLSLPAPHMTALGAMARRPASCSSASAPDRAE